MTETTALQAEALHTDAPRRGNVSRGKVMILALAALTIISAGIAAFFMFGFSNADESAAQTQGVVFDSNASHYESEVEDAGGSSSGIKIPGYPDISASAGTTDLPITLLNPDGNPCNFKFTLSLAETGEELCTTDLVKPGDAIEGVTLSQPLESGEYTLIISIETYSTDTNAQMNGAQVKTKLTVE